MNDTLDHLADTAGLPLARARAALLRFDSLGPASLLSPAQVSQAIELPEGESRIHWAIWAGVAHTAERRIAVAGKRAHGTLGVRWLSEVLPLVCLTLSTSDQIVRLGVVLWSTATRDWLNDILSGKRLNIVLEVPDGTMALHTGRFELSARDMSSLLEFEYAVEEADRGHALRAAALVLLSQPAESDHVSVRLVTETPADVVAMMQLQLTRT